MKRRKKNKVGVKYIKSEKKNAKQYELWRTLRREVISYRGKNEEKRRIEE